MNADFTKLLPWAGSKFWTDDWFMGYLPKEYGVIHMPFGGRLDLLQVLRAHGVETHVHASDISPWLVKCHVAVRDFPEEVISILEEHRQNHSTDYFNSVRDGFGHAMPMAMAGALLVYISRCTYKGIIKISKDGRCTNSNARPVFHFNPDAVRKHSKFLRNTTITAEDYAATAMRAKRGDLVIKDPPYPGEALVHGCLRFTNEDHYRLRNVCNELHRRGVLFLMTNGDTPFIRHIYRNFCIEEIEAPRTLGRAKNGGRAMELVITNY
jgi:DNA adenine methylase